MTANIRTLFLLSLIAGFVDSATFVHLHELFSAHVTGNFVVLAAAIGKGTRANDALKLLAFPVFVLAAFIATVVHDRVWGNKPETAFDHGITLAGGAMLIFAGLIAFTWPGHRGGDAVSLADGIAGMISVAVMGMQNAIHRFAVSLAPPTTVMTGTVTQLTVLAARKIFPRSSPGVAAKAAPPAFSLQGLTLFALAFAVGCMVSVPLTLVFGLVSLIVPGVILAGIAILEREPA